MTTTPLEVGMSASSSHHVDDEAIRLFAQVSGDHNPVHLDESYAKTTSFGGRIAHGMLSASYISAILANQLPGPGTIYLGQELKFLAPVHLGDDLTVTVEVVEHVKGRIWRLTTTASTAQGLVLEGAATVLAPA